MDPNKIRDLEIHLLIETLHLRHGYDFREFSKNSLTRRILQSLPSLHANSIVDLIPKLVHDDTFLSKLISALTVNVSTLFRDPPVFLALRNQVIPLLKTYPFVNIWIAGCANGEEAYSMAILLREEGVGERAQIYATDLDDVALDTATAGVYALQDLEKFEINYRQAGGKGRFLEYCKIQKETFRISPDLQRNILFTGHNLAGDGVFAQMHLILCRNVLIYFDKTLQNRVLKLFHESLNKGGFLCLGDKETVEFSEVRHLFRTLSESHRIYRKPMIEVNTV